MRKRKITPILSVFLIAAFTLAGIACCCTTQAAAAVMPAPVEKGHDCCPKPDPAKQNHQKKQQHAGKDCDCQKQILTNDVKFFSHPDFERTVHAAAQDVLSRGYLFSSAARVFSKSPPDHAGATVPLYIRHSVLRI